VIVLAGDVGGTNARLATVELDDGRARVVHYNRYPSRDYPGLAPIVRRFREETGASPDRACFGIACPVVDDECTAPNLPWTVNARALAADIGIPRTAIINDFAAVGYGIESLGPSDLATLQPGAEGARGNKALCSPGTGLGEAALVREGERYVPVASEGGHSTFSPLDDLDHELARYLAQRHGHVSWERVLSGPGLVAQYEFLRDTQGLEEPDWLAHDLARGEGGAAITRAALERECPLAVRTLERFARLLGVEASNLVLKFLARGGVYLGGGIPPRVLAFLQRPQFLAGFLAKGRMRELLERVAVYDVLNPDCALLGAARHAALDAGLVTA